MPAKRKKVTVTFEGVPASGKTTLLRIAADAFEAAGHSVLIYDPPLNCLEVVLFHSLRRRKSA